MIAGNNKALDTLIKKHKIKLKSFPDSVLKELSILSEKVIKKLVSSDPLSMEVYNSIINFRNLSIKRSEVSEQKFLEIRSKFLS
jgi:TRAP-type mannitol/chloroaromatic compound transport system substrate-binding protein